MKMLQRRLFGIHEREVEFEPRAFPGTDPQRRRSLETLGKTFVFGYNSALEMDPLTDLPTYLDQHTSDRAGFAYEGAGMSLAILDQLPFRKKRLGSFLSGPAAHHKYLVIVGAGWAIAKLPWLRRKPTRFLKQFDPTLKWLAIDGWGFHDGFFSWNKHIQRQIVPTTVKGYAKRVYDQGIGRVHWFVFAADVDRITHNIARFDSARQPDLWAGIGLASSYAGGISQSELSDLMTASGPFHAELAQGVAFAAKARVLSNTVVDATEMACRIICNCSAEQAAQVTDDCLKTISSVDDESYETWRQRIQRTLVPSVRMTPRTAVKTP